MSRKLLSQQEYTVDLLITFTISTGIVAAYWTVCTVAVERTEIDACLHIVKLWLKARIAAHRSVRVQLSQACMSCVLMELRLICLDCSQGMLAKTLTDTKQFLTLYANSTSLNPKSYFKSETKLQFLKRQKCLTSSFWKCAHTHTEVTGSLRLPQGFRLLIWHKLITTLCQLLHFCVFACVRRPDPCSALVFALELTCICFFVGAGGSVLRVFLWCVRVQYPCLFVTVNYAPPPRCPPSLVCYPQSVHSCRAPLCKAALHLMSYYSRCLSAHQPHRAWGMEGDFRLSVCVHVWWGGYVLAKW